MSWGRSKITFIKEGHLKGGRIRNPPDYTGDVSKIRSRAILLIHGFNRNEGEAEELYDIFKNNICSFGKNFNDSIIEILWPGDSYLPFIGSLGRELSYSKKIQVAKECGALLSKDYFIDKLIKNQRSDMEIILIAHSLGCRSILEALRDFCIQNQYKINVKMVLMAAAVPKQFVRRGGRLYDGKQLASSSFVMYSTSDKVLKYFFLPGQVLANEPGEPIGLQGGPKYAWDQSLSMDDFGHGDYWKNIDTARNIANWLGAPTLRTMPSRYPKYQHFVDSRELEFLKMKLKHRDLKDINFPR